MKRKLALILFVLVAAASLVVGFYLVQQNQDLRSKAAPDTSLDFRPTSITKSVGETFTVNIDVDTGENTIASTDLVITYNASVLRAQDITIGNFLTNTTQVQKVLDQPGTIIYSFYTHSTNAKQGTGTLATITFSAIGVGQSQITFGGQTSIYGIGEGQNVISGNLLAASVNITEDGAPTATPTSPFGAPTATNTPRPTATPTNMLPFTTATPTPTTSSGGAPTNTPTATPTTSGNNTAPTATRTPTPTSVAVPTTVPTLPEAGSTETTILLSLGGLLLIMLGSVIIFKR
jgi:LPXTG-motif cell wall-anchored protein